MWNDGGGRTQRAPFARATSDQTATPGAKGRARRRWSAIGPSDNGDGRALVQRRWSALNGDVPPTLFNAETVARRPPRGRGGRGPAWSAGPGAWGGRCARIAAWLDLIGRCSGQGLRRQGLVRQLRPPARGARHERRPTSPDLLTAFAHGPRAPSGDVRRSGQRRHRFEAPARQRIRPASSRRRPIGAASARRGWADRRPGRGSSPVPDALARTDRLELRGPCPDGSRARPRSAADEPRRDGGWPAPCRAGRTSTGSATAPGSADERLGAGRPGPSRRVREAAAVDRRIEALIAADPELAALAAQLTAALCMGRHTAAVPIARLTELVRRRSRRWPGQRTS